MQEQGKQNILKGVTLHYNYHMKSNEFPVVFL